MKVPTLEFRVGDKFFGIEMNKVRHFFEVEEVKKLPFLPEFVVGIARYNDYVYPLISLKKAWGMDEKYDSQTAVAIVYTDKEYAVLIDEIIKIEELEKKENFLVEVFEEDGKLIGNLNLDFLKDHQIPTFENKRQEISVSGVSDDKESFLLLKCNDEILGIETSMIKKVDDYNNEELYRLNGSVLRIYGFDKIYKQSENKSLIFLEDEKVCGFSAGEIIDIYIAAKDEVTNSNEPVFNKYLIYNSQEVKIFSSGYLKKIVNKYGVFVKQNEKKEFDEKEEVLIVNIADEKFAIRMQNVSDIEEYNENAIHYANENPDVKGIVTTKEGATFIFSLENALNKKMQLNEDAKIIVIKSKDVLKALLVNEIEDLVHVNKKNILPAKESENIIGGMVLMKDKMIPLINTDWPKDI